MRILTTNAQFRQSDHDPAFLRQRRNLFVFAFGVMIFELGGAHLTGHVTVGWIGLEFANPCILMWAAWAGLLYALWRYWAHRHSMLQRRDLELSIALAFSPSYRALWNDVMEQRPELIPKSGDEQSVWEGVYQPQLVDTGLFRRAITYLRVLQFDPNTEQWRQSHAGGWPTLVPLKGWNRARALWIELKVTLLSIIRGKWFADYYLPYIVAWIAVALVLDNHFIA